MVAWTPNIEFDYDLGECIKVIYTTPESESLPLRKKSTKFPQLQSFPHQLAFQQKMTEDIEKLNFSNSDQNLSIAQSEALRQLASLDKVVIKPSDKGVNIVLMDSKDYEKMCLDLLQNRDWYRADPNSFQTQLQSRYQSFNAAFNAGTINKDTRVPDSKTSQISNVLRTIKNS